MEIFLSVLGIAAFFVVSYFVIKAAVRNGITEAEVLKREPFDISKPFADGAISQKTCAHCGEAYDVDYPRCPHCKR